MFLRLPPGREREHHGPDCDHRDDPEAPHQPLQSLGKCVLLLRSLVFGGGQGFCHGQLLLPGCFLRPRFLLR